MNKFNYYLEMAATRTIDKDKTYYHGFGLKGNLESIIKDGLKAPELKPGRGNALTPVRGKVYITPELKYAIIYCIGGDMLGIKLRDSEIEKTPKGYLCIISGKKLLDIQPDEDSIGEMIYKKKPEWLLKMAQNNLTPNQYKNVMNGEYDAWAVAGKKLVKIMSDNQKYELIDNGAHVAHEGNILPDEIWEFDKTLNEQLKSDGSNFFELAKRIK